MTDICQLTSSCTCLGRQVDQCRLVSVTTMEDRILLADLRGRWMSPLALSMALKEAGMNTFPTECSPKFVSMHKKVRAQLIAFLLSLSVNVALFL